MKKKEEKRTAYVNIFNKLNRNITKQCKSKSNIWHICTDLVNIFRLLEHKTISKPKIVVTYTYISCALRDSIRTFKLIIRTWGWKIAIGNANFFHSLFYFIPSKWTLNIEHWTCLSGFLFVWKSKWILLSSKLTISPWMHSICQSNYSVCFFFSLFHFFACTIFNFFLRFQFIPNERQ